MQATLNIVTNPFNPCLDRVQKSIGRKTRVNTLVNKNDINLRKPVLCYLNGEPLMRKSWGTTVVDDGDVISFVYLPQGGGGGSNPLKLILMIAITVAAPQLAALAKLGTIGTAILSAGISMAGTMLVNALIPPPSLPKAQQQNQLAAASPTYTVSAQGNQARIGQAIPVLYGTVKVYPDFAAQPYAEFEGNSQFLYQLFVVTQGKANILVDDIFIENSPMTSFAADAQTEVLLPGQKSTIFPTSVYNVVEVSNQELLTGVSAGPFTVNPSNTLVSTLAYDLVCPRGLFTVNDAGDYISESATASLYATEIDAAGVDVGFEFLVDDVTITGATATQIRRTFKYAVPHGRYKVRAVRTDIKSTSNRTADQLDWAGARGYSSEDIDYGDVTMLAIKIKATNTLSSSSSRKISCIARRILPVPVYDGGSNSYDFSTELETNSIAWAIADMCRADYGAGVVEARYNIAQLVAFEALFVSRGDSFNAIYDSTQTFWDAISLAARAGRMRPFIQGGLIHFTRDSVMTLPTALFSVRNMVKGSFKMTYIMTAEDTADAVDVEYFDENVWKPRVVRAQLDVEAPTTIAKVKSFGITNRDQAWREAMASAAANRYRRKEIYFETELEGHIPALGDLIAVQNDIPEWGQHGEIVDETAGVFTVNENLEWTDGVSHFVMLRRPNGSPQGPLEVSQFGVELNKFTLTFDATDFTVRTGSSGEKTHISFGRAGNVVQLAKVLSIVPRDKTVAITAINEDARVHSADGTAVPPDLYVYGISAPSVRPILTDFTVVQTGSGLTPSLSISWEPTAGASRYFIEKSTDNENWESVGEVTVSNFSFLANLGTIYVRVAAYGGVLGPYVNKTIEVGEVAPPIDVTVGSIAANNQNYDIIWTGVVDADAYYVEVYEGANLVRSFNTTTTNFTYSIENAITDGGPWRSVEVRIKATKGPVSSATALSLTGTNAAPAAPILTLVAANEAVSVSISPSIELDYLGTKLHSSLTPTFTPSPANLIYQGTGGFFLDAGVTVQTYYKAAHYDTYGTTGLNYSAEVDTTPVATVAGVEVVAVLPATGNFEGRVVYLTTDDSLYTYDADGASWNISGSDVADGSITEVKLAADSVTAVKISAGAVTASKITVGNLAAINANMGNITAGNITVDASGFIQGGQTAYGTGTGFWLGYDTTTYKFSLGSATDGLTWDGTELDIKGNLSAGTIGIGSKFSVTSDGTVSIKSATSGARLEIDDDVIKVYDASGVLRVKLGNLA
jgi:sulfur carrier protein ThiS